VTADPIHDPTHYGTQWRRPPLIRAAHWRRLLYGGVALYLVLGIGALDIDWVRLSEGWTRGWRFLAGFAQPDFRSRWDAIAGGLLESLTMTLTATLVGILLAVPVGIGAARNLVGLPLYLLCRAIIAVSRALQEIIIAILFVAMVGFGPFAGFLTLSVATVGFLAKLLAADIETVDPAPVEAVRAAGASPAQVLDYGIVPQILPALAGISLFRWDINIRESTVLGLVGAGGIGLALKTSVDTLAWPQVTLIFLLILATVLLSEWVSARVRRGLI